MPSRVGTVMSRGPEPTAVTHRRLVERTDNPKEDLVLRPKLDWRAAVTGGALVLATTCAAAVPAAARR